MGGAISFLIGVVATWLFHKSDSSIFFWVSLVSTLVTFWSWGIMHNYATETAKMRREYMADLAKSSGATDQEIKNILNSPLDRRPTDISNVPHKLVNLNIASTLISLIMLIVALVKLIF